ncbi:RNA polymerase sigma factor [Robinsoniella peoriensis]|uniref:RNA polymerase sigma factor n=1 Tax=Robinsoniella peoriensis TaxID=180332 RepID=UPI0036342D32
MQAAPCKLEATDICLHSLSVAGEQLHNAISKLPEVQRRRLLLYYFAELTYEQIAEMEGCSVHSIFVAIERAKENLKKFLI